MIRVITSREGRRGKGQPPRQGQGGLRGVPPVPRVARRALRRGRPPRRGDDPAQRGGRGAVDDRAGPRFGDLRQGLPPAASPVGVLRVLADRRAVPHRGRPAALHVPERLLPARPQPGNRPGQRRDRPGARRAPPAGRGRRAALPAAPPAQGQRPARAARPQPGAAGLQRQSRGPARGPPPPRARPRRPAPAAPGALLRRPVLERDVLAAHHAAGHRRGVRSAPPPASRTRADGCGRWRRASWPTSWASRRSP
ncbi:hypothetical protein LX15_002241 [Streptoalloteichus tenebrarius]|uniref:Uncharacterized protein n=1 Tax=Streptoalloteichus tenebrarius (strain ATCC 17920 / DSM 40477 / JCM 4838 / CBS 697.72 / NBRC 16177 / NCIMB 11028 / NRRL B-12390 / A12253. 1 / ISP 5477) TaxID=1933 RepID=A0ABT1HSP9_STRSD|nr:hypothetical protein [Streptoalloteichus tenebrarius]